MARSYQSDVVDDSEPEREELRVQERKRSLRDHTQYQNTKSSLDVADLLDDNFTSGQGPANASSSKVSVELVNIQLPHGTPVRNTHVTDNIQSITEEDEPTISLARFAYSGTMAKKKIPIISPGLSRQASVASSIADSQLPVKKSTHTFAAHFSDSDLKKVAKCVSCDVHWTARKSVVQKMLHIQSCAKKKGLTDETVQILLRKEIESCMADNESHRGKEKCVDPQTLFEGVLAETAPKKKARRKEAIETVKTISGTRNTILERARAIIAPTSSSRHKDDESPLHTQVLGASGSHCNNVVPPPTQAFGKSALPQARQPTRKLFDYDVDFSNTEGCSDGTPSNSPTFAPSRLGCHLNTGRSLNSSANHLSVRRLPSVDVINDSSRERVLNARTKIPHERFSGSPFNKPMSSPERDNNGHSFILCNRDMSILDSLDHDNAFFHFDPEFDHLPGDMPLIQTIRTKAESNLSKAPLSKIQSHTLTESKTATKSSPSIKTKKTRAKAATKMKSPLDDETVESLELKFQDKISQDTDLHLRILRYEPIHFDVFLKLMLGDSFSSASDKARLRMRSLLDKQAIHFYGSEKKRRRRR